MRTYQYYIRSAVVSKKIVRMAKVTLLIAASVTITAGIGRAQSSNSQVDNWIDESLPQLIETYQWLHANPEVSFQEEETGKYVAKKWSDAGFDVTTKVGGFGVVGILKNGPGPLVMLRTDLDALPVTEATDLPFASEQTIETESGATSGVMHACGHDVHMTNVIGVADFMASHKELWSGTLMLVGQPAEERGSGAKAMLDDKLFERFGKPDYAVALHTHAETASGTIGVRSGYSLANVDSVDIDVKGRGGHGSAPETTIDPVIQACELVVALQTIVSREVKPLDPAVVTVGSIHGGTKHNIIGDSCHLQITVRSYKPEVRQQILAAIKRKANAIAIAYGAPEPEIEISEGTPALYNDPDLNERLTKVFQNAIGSENVTQLDPVMGGEDFSQFGLAGVPIVMYRLGTVDQRRLDHYKQINEPPPSLHSPRYYPDLENALPVGLKTMISAALDLLKKN